MFQPIAWTIHCRVGDRHSSLGPSLLLDLNVIGTTKVISCAWMAGKKEFSAVVVKLSRVTIQRGVRSVGVAGKEPGWMDWCRLKEDYEES